MNAQDLVRMRDCLLKASREMGSTMAVDVALGRAMLHLYDEFGDENSAEIETLLSPFAEGTE